MKLSFKEVANNFYCILYEWDSSQLKLTYNQIRSKKLGVNNSYYCIGLKICHQFIGLNHPVVCMRFITIKTNLQSNQEQKIRGK